MVAVRGLAGSSGYPPFLLLALTLLDDLLEAEECVRPEVGEDGAHRFEGLRAERIRAAGPLLVVR